ncbi:MAG: DUF3124 domain-containing protein [Cyanobacteria bacterium J06592_8]
MFNTFLRIKLLIPSILVVFLMSCNRDLLSNSTASSTEESESTYIQIDEFSPEEIVDFDNLKVAVGQVIYVPVYSHIYYMNTRQIYNLATTLSVRNTDQNREIIIKTVNYYNTEGQLVQSYLEQGIRLSPLASTDFFVEQSNSKGGAGANFIVEWVAEEAVTEPIIEAVSIGTAGTQGIAFTSSGKVLKKVQE